MNTLKEVVVFSEQGDPRDFKTWSNVPYFFVKTLEDRGIIVHTVNLSVQSRRHRYFTKVFNFVASEASKNIFYDYSRSAVYYYYSRLKIKQAVKKYKNADAFIFTTFSLSSHNFSSKPSILFCDWTIKHHIQYYLERDPTRLELAPIQRQDNVIEKADFVFVLFPAMAERMLKKYTNKNIHYIGNVINNLIVSDDLIIEKKVKSNKLLFVGTRKYLQGAVDLINAYLLLKKHFPELLLDIIGLENTDIEFLPPGVTCHGYLDKGVSSQADQYYELVINARLFINTTPKWGAFSACLEAMYFYTPVVVTAYKEFTETFGQSIAFGAYYKTEETDLADTIMQLLANPDYDSLCTKANEAAREHTWNQYVDNMIRIIELKSE
jgi:glycosyltransferase involved in cell wall biosynthesis